MLLSQGGILPSGGDIPSSESGILPPEDDILPSGCDIQPSEGTPPIQGAIRLPGWRFRGRRCAIGAHEGASEADGRALTQCATPWVRPCLYVQDMDLGMRGAQGLRGPSRSERSLSMSKSALSRSLDIGLRGPSRSESNVFLAGMRSRIRANGAGTFCPEPEPGAAGTFCSEPEPDPGKFFFYMEPKSETSQICTTSHPRSRSRSRHSRYILPGAGAAATGTFCSKPEPEPE